MQLTQQHPQQPATAGTAETSTKAAPSAMVDTGALLPSTMASTGASSPSAVVGHDSQLTQERLLEDELELMTESFDLFERASVSIFKKYAAAITQIEARFAVLDADLEYRLNRNPIHHVESRLKKPKSVFEKLKRRSLPITIEAMEHNITDIAGVRVVCSYIDDVYALERVLLSQDDLQLVKRKDYIANPKPNGYRSLHIIVLMPVFFLDRKQYVPVEIQLRTVAMDFWASLEHTLKYKRAKNSQVDDALDLEISSELKRCSETIEGVERRMQGLVHLVETEDVLEAARDRRQEMKDQAKQAKQLQLKIEATSQFHRVRAEGQADAADGSGNAQSDILAQISGRLPHI